MPSQEPGAAAGLVVLDAATGPVGEQVHDQLLAHVAAGRLAPGDRLPTVRALAAELGISTATVAKAYRRLEAAGVTTTATRAGTVVRGDAPAEGADPRAGAAADALARAAVEAGLSDEGACALLLVALRRARRPGRGAGGP